MILSDIAVTAITNFILAGETFFLSGLLFARPKTARTAAWFWQLALLTMAMSAMLGGIDHGFLEVQVQPSARQWIAHVNWFLIGLLTLFVFLTIAQQFLEHPWRRVAHLAAVVQLLIYAPIMAFQNSYRVVILNYLPVMFLLLVCNSIGLRRGTGTWNMNIAILITMLSSAVQAAGIDAFSPLDRNGLYHLGMMLALVFFYKGGLGLKGMAPMGQ
jgi:hypothetical protein